MKLRILAFVGILIGAGVAGLSPIAALAAEPASTAKPAISAAAIAAVKRMGQTLSAREFSFRVQTIRVYAGPKGEPLHIFHALDVTVQRPNKLLVLKNGDDGPGKLIYDGKTLVVYMGGANKYVSIPMPNTIEAMMKEAMGRLGVDFPLADFLTNAPGQSFLSGVTAGEIINTMTIDGVPCLHMFFSQPPGIELELWLEKNDRSLPLRLIVTYRSLPGEPNFVATFSDWNFSIHPSDAQFVFQPPPGAEQVALKLPTGALKQKAGGGSK
jgi:hypothetical protein